MTQMMHQAQNTALQEGVQILHRGGAPVPTEPPCCLTAVYARVSTDKEEQASSLRTQMEAFQSAIAARPGWELTEVYVDEGLSGTQAGNRTAFQRMMADCEAGKIQYIITKSIARFARNTMECLQYVRRLKEIGVFVYFDKEKLDTATAASEMLLTILAAAAQEESRSLSENLKWGYRKRFAAGEPKWVNTYGFIKGEDGEYVIHEEQARGVRRIFALCLEGYSLPRIAGILEKESIPAMGGGKWWPKSLATVLHNEKYCGDVMMQKSYTVDHLSHKKVVNDRTVLPSYYVRDHHEAIVDRKTFDLAQRILSLKDRHLGSVQYPYFGLLFCPICGARMFRFGIIGNGRPAAWTCGGCGDGRPSQCPPYAVKEKYIDQLVQDAYHALDTERLTKLARKRDPVIRESATAALAWKEKSPRLKTIPFTLLNDLVERITLRKWSEGEVTWRFGLKTRMRVEYERISDIPRVELESREDGYYLDGERVDQGRHVNACLMNIRENVVRARVEAAEMLKGRLAFGDAGDGEMKNLVIVDVTKNPLAIEEM